MIRSIIIPITLTIALGTSASACSGGGSVPVEARQDVLFRADAPAPRWVESFPLGNGRIGMMSDGATGRETVVLNEISTWTGSKDDADNPMALDSLGRIRELLFAGRNDEAQELMTRTFVCGGSMVVEDKKIRCHALGGHGGQTFVQAICNSCNPAFIQIGQLVGLQKFRDYYKGFGFADKSGIDLPGESEDMFWGEGEMSTVDFAVASFGQNFGITPIQMITACAAVANGGYVLQPYVVSKITDSKGNVVKSVEKKVKRQVISKKTSDKMNEILGYNTETAGATAGYVSGYRVAGKTGTSEKIGVTEKQSTFDEDYIASFCGYAPADDPQIAMLVFFDTPSGEAYYGSQVSSPVFINIMTEVLPYLQIKTNYSEANLKYLDSSAGDYTGLSVEEAENKVKQDGFTCTVKGSGSKVIDQLPAISSKVSAGGNVVLYTDSESRAETVMVPNFIGYTAIEANNVASQYDLNAIFKGAISGGGTCTAQSVKEGEKVSPGTVITLTFSAASSEGFND